MVQLISWFVIGFLVGVSVSNIIIKSLKKFEDKEIALITLRVNELKSDAKIEEWNDILSGRKKLEEVSLFVRNIINEVKHKI